MNAIVSSPVAGVIDPGIERAVLILQANGVETFESCEGGRGHAFPEPTIRFYGTPAAGPRAVAVCMDHGLPIMALRRVWYMENNEMTGPNWELTFRISETIPESVYGPYRTQQERSLEEAISCG